MSSSSCRQGSRDRSCCGQIGRAPDLLSCRAAPGSTVSQERALSPAPLSAARCVARTGRPYSRASCRRPPRARVRSSRSERAFVPRRRWQADTSGPTAGPAPNAGGAPGGKPLGVCARLLPGMAAPIKPTDVSVRNSLRDFDISPPNGIFQSHQRIANKTSGVLLTPPRLKTRPSAGTAVAIQISAACQSKYGASWGQKMNSSGSCHLANLQAKKTSAVPQRWPGNLL